MHQFQKGGTMDRLKISTAQFENKNGDKAYNISVIEKLTKKAAVEGSKVIAFHECSITGYTFARHLSKKQMLELAEFIPEGDSIIKLTEIAKKKYLHREVSYKYLVLLKQNPRERHEKICYKF